MRWMRLSSSSMAEGADLAHRVGEGDLRFRAACEISFWQLDNESSPWHTLVSFSVPIALSKRAMPLGVRA